MGALFSPGECRRNLAALAVFAALPMFFPSGCSDPQVEETPPPVTDYCGDIKRAVFPIINGTEEPDPSVCVLSESQRNAIGVVMTDVPMGELSCTGTLIGPNTVLTAAHCIDHASQTIRFFVGRDVSPSRRLAVFSSAEWYIHPMHPGYVSEHDIALFIIEGDPIAEGITPIPVNCEETDLAGETVQATGYGLTSPTGSTSSIRLWTTITVEDDFWGMYMTYGEDTGPCFGDSGGPLLYTKEDGEVNVMGVASGVENRECSGYSFYASTYLSCDFLGAYLYRAHAPCWGETSAGRCSDDRLIRCDDGVIVIEDCRESGMTCEQQVEGPTHCALPPVPPDPCEGETFAGRCEGDRAVWCSGGTVIWKTCSGGQLCGDAGDGLNRCVGECDLMKPEGKCDEAGTSARWCENGVLKVRDCGACRQTCGWTGDALGYYCM